MGGALATLETLGLESVLAGAGGTGANVCRTGQQAARWPSTCRRAWPSTVPPSMRRSRAAALEAGAAFLPETTAEVAPDDAPGTVIAHGPTEPVADEPTLRAKCRVILAADGLGHASVRHIEAFRSQHRRPAARLGLGLSFGEPRDVYASAPFTWRSAGAATWGWCARPTAT